MADAEVITATDGASQPTADAPAAVPTKPVVVAEDPAAARKAEREAAAFAELKSREAGNPPKPVLDMDMPAEDSSVEDGESDAQPTSTAKAPKADATKPTKGTPEARREIAKAEQALLRDGYTREDLKDLPEASLLRLGAKALEKHRQRDREYAARKAGHPSKSPTRTESDALDVDDPDQVYPDDDGDPSSPSPGEPDGELESLLREIDEPSGRTIRGTLTRAQERERVLAEQAAAAKQASLRDALELTRLRLSGTVKALAKDDAHLAVCKEMDQIDPGHHTLAAFYAGEKGAREALIHLYERAAGVVYGDQQKQAARRDRADRISEALDGQPEVGSRRASDAVTLSKEKRAAAAFKAIDLAGGDEDQAKAIFNRLTGSGVG
jgi:hypothetical protein